MRRISLVAILLTVGLGAARSQPDSSSPVRSVDVNGHAIRVRTGGLQQPRTPVVIFEAGGTDTLDSWDPIFGDVAKLTSAVAYDRPGNGRSATDGEPPTPAHIANALHALLEVLHVSPPYVLVGHSWGGPLIRMFAGLYPGEVAGLLYIDPTDIRTEEEDAAYWGAQGFTPEAAAARKTASRTGMIAAGGEMKVMAETSAAYFKDFRSLPPVPAEIPVTVLMSDRFSADAWPPPRPCAPRDCHDASIRFRTRQLMAMSRASTNGTFVLATGRGHYIHKDDPALVMSAIQRVLGLATNASPNVRPRQ